MNDAAMLISEDLEFDMMRIDDEFLDVDLRITESLLRLEAGGVIALHQTSLVAGDPHAASAATRDGFDHDGKTNFSRNLERFFLAIDDSVTARTNRYADLAGTIASGILVPHQTNGGRRWADELDITAGADFGKMPVFRKKSVTGMNRINIGDFCGADDAIDLKITLRAGRRSDADGFVGELNMEAFHVGLGIDSHSLDAELFASPNDAKGDFASIGDEDFVEHS